MARDGELDEPAIAGRYARDPVGTVSGACWATGGAARRDAGDALRPLGGGNGCAGEHQYDVPCPAACRLDAKKKSLIASERDEAARAAFRAKSALWEAARLIFIDESGTQTTMTPRYSRAPRGERAVGRAPRNHDKNTTLVAALSLSGLGAAMTLEGALDSDAFAAYLAAFLVPTLVAGQIVVMDNLSVHKDKRVRPLIEGAGCTLVYLPAYSPDLTPIEQAFSKIKEALRRAGARSREALEEAITAAMAMVTAADAEGWFTHCGYLPPSRQSA